MIHCESILEADAARLFEISYFVKSYRSQPSQETYYDNEGNPRTYYPDFEVTLWDDSLLDVEVKPASKLYKPEIKGKFEAIVRRYQEQSRRFRILTEDNVRSEPLGSNLKLLAYCLHVPVHIEKLKALKQRLAESKAITLAQATEILGQESCGLFDYVSKIIDRAVLIAGERGYTALTLKTFAEAFQDEVWRDAPKRLNPFNDKAVLRSLTKNGEPFEIWDDPGQYTSKRTE
jgi:TnsA endonuclease N terminal